MSEPFSTRLASGKEAERAIANFLRDQGHSVLFAAEVPVNAFRGPQLYYPGGSVPLPDLLVFPIAQSGFFAEVKLRENASWHRSTGNWQTGIENRYLEDYLKVAEYTSLQIFLYFVQVKSKPSSADERYGCPAECPTGIFKAEAKALAESISHRWQHGFTQPRVYWNLADLEQVAPLEAIRQFNTIDSTY